jgi:hypothetical protein
MLISEFEHLTKFYPTTEDYEVIEMAYASAGLDKDEFCRRWLTNGGPNILYYKQVRRNNNADISALRALLSEIHVMLDPYPAIRAELSE